MSYRRLWVLIDHLPQESWTQTALRDQPRENLPARNGEQEFGPWALLNYQMAGLTDAVNAVAYLLQAVNAKDPKSVEVPKPTARPGMKRLTRHLADSAEVEAARRYLRQFNGQEV